MRKAVSLVALFLMLTATIKPLSAVADTSEGCLPFVKGQESIFSVWGESEHWALILQGLGTCQDGRIHTAKALPYLVWTGGAEIPRSASVTFIVKNMTCVNGSVGVLPTKVVRIADCKLVYPGQGLLSAKRPQELVEAITEHGQFKIAWDGATEQITWRYGYPPITK